MYGDYTSHSPSVFTVRQLDFDGSASARRREGMTTCAIVGTVVVFFYVMMMLMPQREARPRRAHRYFDDRFRTGCDHVRGMVSRAGVAISARVAQLRDTDVFTYDASRFYAEAKTSSVISLVEKHARDNKALTAAELTDADRAACKTALKTFLDANDRVLIMVFAPWCGHCKGMMPRFAAAVGDRKAIMVNGDCMPEDVMAGRDCLPTVGYYPLLLVHRGGTATVAGSPEEAIRMYDEGSPAATKALTAATEAMEDADGLFDSAMAMAKRSGMRDMRYRKMDTESDGRRSRDTLGEDRGVAAHDDRNDFMDDLF